VIISLVILFFFSLAGLLFKNSRSVVDELILSSIKGYIIIIGLSYFISYNFMLSGADSVLITLILLSVWISFKFIKFIFIKYKHIFVNKTIINIYCITIIIPLITILLPANILGIENFYGVFNFDFFYNSQDSFYLSNHNVLDFSSSDYILPFDWSANEQGRFAISLIGAFIVKYFKLNPLEFNSYLLTTLIIINAQVFYIFARRILMMKYYMSLGATLVFILSAPFVQGYIYYLLGQISAIPIFIYILILFKNLIKNYTVKKLIWFIFVLNVLYIVYAILSVYVILLILTSIFIYFKRYNLKYSYIFFSILLFLFLFFSFRISNLDVLYQNIIQWITLSMQTASAEKGILVFSEYLTETGFLIQWGLVTYPSNNSLLGFIHELEFGSLIFLFVSLVVVFSYIFIIYKLKNRLDFLSYLIIIILSFIVLSSSILFYVLLSPYPLFKTSVWFIPILLPLFLYGLSYRYKIYIIFISIAILVLNLSNTINYLGSFYLKKENPYLSIDGISKYEVMQIRNFIKNEKITNIAINMVDGIKSAWVGNYFRDISINNVTHNLQPLSDKNLDNKDYKLNSEYLLTQKDNTDIFSKNIFTSSQPLFSTLNYDLYKIADLKLFGFIGTGTYQPTILSDEIVRKSGLPKTFRWVEDGLELLIYSNQERFIDLSFDIRTGYAKVEKERNIIVKNINTNANDIFTFNEKSRIDMKKVLLIKGINKILIKSKDKVEQSERTDALFRKDITLDTRLLNFMISNINIISMDYND
jgi:hypothetical protein